MLRKKANDQYGLSRASSDLASAFFTVRQMDKAFFLLQESYWSRQGNKQMPTLVATIQTRFSNEYLGPVQKSGEKKYADSASLLAKKHWTQLQNIKTLSPGWKQTTLLQNRPCWRMNQQNYTLCRSHDCFLSERRSSFDRLLYEAYSKRSKTGYQLENYQQAELFADSAMIYGRAFNPQMEAGACRSPLSCSKANGHIENHWRFMNEWPGWMTVFHHCQ